MSPDARDRGGRRLVPGKRLRNWHRQNGLRMSLRAFARGIAGQTLVGYDADESVIAKQWLGARP